MSADSLYDTYAKLRRDGYGPFGAGVQMRVTESASLSLERAFKAENPDFRVTPDGKPRETERHVRSPGPGRTHVGLGPYAEPIAPSQNLWLDVEQERDEAFVRCVLALGGYPTGTPKGPVGPDGKPWRRAAA